MFRCYTQVRGKPLCPFFGQRALPFFQALDLRLRGAHQVSKLLLGKANFLAKVADRAHVGINRPALFWVQKPKRLKIAFAEKTILDYVVRMDLKSYLKNHRMTETAFAVKLGVSQRTVNRYVQDERFPSPEMILRITEVTGGKVKIADWYTARANRAAKSDERASA